MMLAVGMKVHTKVGDGCITAICGGVATVRVDDPSKNHMAPYYAAPLRVIEEFNGMSDDYAQDRDAGHEEPWRPIGVGAFASEWGAERALYSRQLQDANKRIHELEQELQKLREEKHAREQAIKTPSDPTVSVPLSAWNKLCAEAAKARPLAEEEPEAFPARALRFSA